MGRSWARPSTTMGSLGPRKEFLGPVWVMKKVEKLIEFFKMETRINIPYPRMLYPLSFFLKSKFAFLKEKWTLTLTLLN